MPGSRDQPMDDYVARALYYYELCWDFSTDDRLSWERVPEATRNDFLLKARTAIEAFTDWRRSHGLDG